jgi:hypothetical protein
LVRGIGLSSTTGTNDETEKAYNPRLKGFAAKIKKTCPFPVLGPSLFSIPYPLELE